jgi:hypothetical protein
MTSTAVVDGDEVDTGGILGVDNAANSLQYAIDIFQHLHFNVDKTSYRISFKCR